MNRITSSTGAAKTAKSRKNGKETFSVDINLKITVQMAFILSQRYFYIAQTISWPLQRPLKQPGQVLKFVTVFFFWYSLPWTVASQLRTPKPTYRCPKQDHTLLVILVRVKREANSEQIINHATVEDLSFELLATSDAKTRNYEMSIADGPTTSLSKPFSM